MGETMDDHYHGFLISAENFKISWMNSFTPERPNAVWCSDITYIWIADGFVYLTSIMDLYSRKIIGMDAQPDVRGIPCD